MGKIDIDYQKLHDAFFKWQTKPKMSIHGDLYYEVREGFSQGNHKEIYSLRKDTNVGIWTLTFLKGRNIFLTLLLTHMNFKVFLIENFVLDLGQ